MTADVVDLAAASNRQLLNRLRLLLKTVEEATDELETALLADDVVTAAAAGRRLASAGWLMRDATDRHERSRT